MKKWYVVRTKVNQEGRAVKNLILQNFLVFCPQEPNINIFENKLKKIKPLFPSYLFVKLNLKYDNWTKINHTYGVVEILRGTSFAPQSIPSEFVENLAKYAKGNKSDFIDQFKLFKGQNVKFLDGPFWNKIAKIEELKSKERVFLLLKVFSREVKILVEKSKILPV